MKNTRYRSFLGAKIQEFILQKRAAGHPYKTGEGILLTLDKMIAENYNDETHLSKKICDAWIKKSSSLHNNTIMRRMTPVRQLGKYLINTGELAYIIPTGIPQRQIKYEPHIYTEEEIKAFFESADQCKRSKVAPAKHFIVPTLFRLLFTTGMRISEARKLLVDDIDLHSGKIIIRESKGWSERIIYVHPEVLDLLNRYYQHVRALYPDTKQFFPNRFGRIISKETIRSWFHEIWDHLPLAANVKGNQPRIHDFRHTFCVYRLNEWVRNGAEVSGLYVYLSEYVGHSNFSDTDYYLTLAEPFYPDLKTRMHSVNSMVLPEVIQDEW